MVPTRCKHNFLKDQCNLCESTEGILDLGPDALCYTADGRPALVLRRDLEKRRAKVLQLDEQRPIMDIDSLTLRAAPVNSRDWDRYRDRFDALARRQGHIVRPTQALTKREEEPDGPPTCSHCKRHLSFALRSLGCERCRGYVCRCGSCLCGVEGRNYLGDYFNCPGPPPVERSVRLEYVKVLRYCDGQRNLAR